MPDKLPSLPPGARTALGWCAVAAFALVLYGTLGSAPEPLHPGPHDGLRLAGWRWAVVAIVPALPLGWVRRRPLPVFALVLAAVVTLAAVGARTEQIWPLMLAADGLIALLAATRSHRVSVTAAIVATAVQEVVWLRELGADGGSSRVLAVGMLAIAAVLALLALLAWIAGTTVRQRREHADTLRVHATAQAVTDERMRIARELHDTLAHDIGIIAIQSGAARRVIDTRPAEARSALTAIETTSRDLLKGLRHLLGAVRDPEPGAGLADVGKLAETVTAAGVRVDVRWSGRRRPLPAAHDRSAFRIIQEAVTNVVRHAATDHCRVSIGYGGDDLRIEILDDGAGPAAGQDGYGIAGMRERAGLLGGSLSAGSRPEGGFRVAARLPLPGETR